MDPPDLSCPFHPYLQTAHKENGPCPVERRLLLARRPFLLSFPSPGSLKAANNLARIDPLGRGSVPHMGSNDVVSIKLYKLYLTNIKLIDKYIYII
jgi:hypothetical protein